MNTHVCEKMSAEQRPQDLTLDGKGLAFETLEHGGEFPDSMPQAIKITDVSGNWCIYLPTKENGKVVRSLGFSISNVGEVQEIPFWAKEEIQHSWNKALSCGSQLEAYRILEKMVDRLVYGRT